MIKSVALIQLIQPTPEGNYLAFQNRLIVGFNETWTLLGSVVCVVDSEQKGQN